MEFFEPLADYARNALDSVNRVISKAADQFTDLVSDTYDQAKAVAKQSADDATQFAEDVAERSKANIEEAANKAAETGEAVGKDLQALAEVGRRKAEQIVAESKAKIAQAAKSARQGAQKLKEYGNEKVEELEDWATERIDNFIDDEIQAAGKSGKEEITKEFCAARSAIEGKDSSTNDTREKIYVNAGAWVGGRSDFVLVSGPFVVLCSWLDVGDNSLPEKWNRGDPSFKKIDGFLKKARAKPIECKASIKDAAKANSNLMPEGKILICIGDLHINLFKESPVDNFRLLNGSTLAVEFGKFVDHAREQAGTPNNVVQVGDCFEVWESQIVMHLAREEKVRVVRKGSEEPLTDDEMADFVRNPAKIEKAIMDLYAEHIKWDQFNRQVRGNHDNDAQGNEVLRKLEYAGYTGSVPNDKEYVPLSRGVNNCIAIEHGDAFDPTNRIDEYDKPGRGFSKTMSWVAGYELFTQMRDEFWGHHLVRKSNREILDKGDEVATAFLSSCARIRASYLHHHIACGQKEPIRLVVMGHSHAPTIIRNDNVASLRPSLREDYFTWLGAKGAGVLFESFGAAVEGVEDAWDATKSGVGAAVEKTKDIADGAWTSTKDGAAAMWDALGGDAD